MGERILYKLLPILKVILFLFFVILCLIPFGIIAQLNFIPFQQDSIITDLVVESSLTLAIFGALLMMFKILPSVYFSDVFIVKEGVFTGFAKGTTIGVILVLFCVAILYLTGFVQLNANQISVTMFFGYLLFFLVVAMFEELMFRTFPLFVFAERYPIVITILINGLLFAFVHAGNPGFTWLAMLNITLAGALFSLFTLLKKNISWAIGIHFGWNFAQGILMGYKVSGTNTPAVLSAKPVGQAFVSGGSFGIEGSVVCTAVFLAMIIFILKNYKIEPIVTKELIEE
ncbi:MAG: CPBP family intramembrane metalloprotease [Pedobacter sp.]|nr:MAG: CPBP family intramembrane metalloprotease [Pedobacter sp.]